MRITRGHRTSSVTLRRIRVGLTISLLTPACGQSSPAIQAGELVDFSFKFSPGTVRTFKQNVRLEMGGGPGASAIFPAIRTVYSADMTETCLELKDGRARLRRVSTIRASTTTVNGQPQQPGAASVGSSTAPGTVKDEEFSMSLLGEEKTLKKGSVESAETRSNLTLRLPGKPVRPGDTWDAEVVKDLPQFPGRGKGSAADQTARIKVTFRLKELRVIGGRRVAIIEASGAGSTKGQPADSTESIQCQIRNTIEFDVERGFVRNEGGDVLMQFKVRADAVFPKDLLEQARAQNPRFPATLDYRVSGTVTQLLTGSQ